MRTPRPPYPDIETAATLAEGRVFRNRLPQLPATPDIGVSDAQVGALQEAFKQAPLGDLGIDVDVRSIYDVRPINAFDVNVAAESADFSYGGSATPQVGTITVPVPLGYVFVVRQLDHYLTGMPPVVERQQVLLTLTKNGAGVPYNTDVPVGLESQGLFRTFVILDEGEVFGARARVLLPDAPQSTTKVGVNFYGNFLRKTGRNANQQIGNPVAGGLYKLNRG